LVAAPEENGGSAVVGGEGDLSGEAGLADARLTGDDDDLGLASDGLLPAFEQPFELVPSADEGASALGREGRREGDSLEAGRLPEQFPGGERLGESLQLERPERSKVVVSSADGEEAGDL